MKLSTRIISLIIIITVFLGATSLLFTNYIIHGYLFKLHDKSARLLTTALSESISYHVINSEKEQAKLALNSILKNDETISYIYITDFNGKVFVHTFKTGFPEKLAKREVIAVSSTKDIILDGIKIIEYNYPLVENLPAQIFVGFKNDNIENVLYSALINIVVLFIIITLIGAITAYIFGRKLVNPLEKFTTAIKKMTHSANARPIQFDVKQPEIKDLQKAFNNLLVERQQMISTLHTQQQHLEDIVERRTTELKESRDEAIVANRAKDAFLSQISHELRTPMNAVLGFTQLLLLNKKEEQLTKEQIEQIKHIEVAGTHLLNVINQMLDLTQMSTGKFHINQQMVDVCPIIKNVIEIIKPLKKTKNISIVNLLSEQNSISAYTDDHALQQVLINLLNNAIKFSPSGSSITLSSLINNDYLRLCVSDEGQGISEIDIQRIFEPFERANTDSFIEGSGIGLTVCKNIMELMNGQIGVDSIPGEGSTFWIDIPLNAIAEN